GRSFEQGVHHAVGRLAGAFSHQLLHASSAKQFSAAVARIQNAVAEEDKHIAGLHLERELIVVGIVEKAKRQTGRFDHMILPGMHMNRARQAWVSYLQGLM